MGQMLLILAFFTKRTILVNYRSLYLFTLTNRFQCNIISLMKTYTFNDVLIQPQYTEVRSRKNVDTSVDMGNIHLDIPVMSANMKTITGPRMAAEMRNRGALGILHRFGSIEESVRDFEDKIGRA